MCGLNNISLAAQMYSMRSDMTCDAVNCRLSRRQQSSSAGRLLYLHLVVAVQAARVGVEVEVEAVQLVLMTLDCHPQCGWSAVMQLCQSQQQLQQRCRRCSVTH